MKQKTTSDDTIKQALELSKEALEYGFDVDSRFVKEVLFAIEEALKQLSVSTEHRHIATKADPDTLHATYGGGFTNKDFENVMRLKREQQLMGCKNAHSK